MLEKTATCKHLQKPLSRQRIRKRAAQENRWLLHSNNPSPTKHHKINCGPFSKSCRNLRLLPLPGCTEAIKGPTPKWYHRKLSKLSGHLSLLGDNKPPYLSVNGNHIGNLHFYPHMAGTRCLFSPLKECYYLRPSKESRCSPLPERTHLSPWCQWRQQEWGTATPSSQEEISKDLEESQ